MYPRELAEITMLACFIEVTTPKVGNVYPGASFSDMSDIDFYRSAVAVSQAVRTSSSPISFGRIAQAMIESTRSYVSVNTNLGTVLLLAPLIQAASELQTPFQSSPRRNSFMDSLLSCDPVHFESPSFRIELTKWIEAENAEIISDNASWQAALFQRLDLLHMATARTLDLATDVDARSIFRTIAIAKPGGLGTVEEMDIHQLVRDESQLGSNELLLAMQLAEDRDDVAKQYSQGYSIVFNICRQLAEGLIRSRNWLAEVRALQIKILSERVDSLIVRKGGNEVGQLVQRRAISVLQSGQFGTRDYEAAWGELDRFLREDGHALNPGTTADLIAASIWAMLWAIHTTPI